MRRLRAALDELTDGTEPNESRLTPLTSRRPRRWLVPALGAAAVALVVGVAITVAGRGDSGRPATPTPTGPPVTPVPAPSEIPWYGLAGPDGVITTPPIDGNPSDYDIPQVWAAPDYSRVVVATAAAMPDASATPDDWPVLEELTGMTSGVAWAFSGDPPARWHGIYWAPDDGTSVVVTGFGFSPDELAALLPALHVEHDDTGPRVVAGLSSLVPLADGAPGFYTAPIYASDVPLNDGYATSLAVSAGGAARPLALLGPAALAITPTTTPFGPGFRIETDGPTHVWWQVDGGPFWAGLTASPDQIDDLLVRVTRVADIAAPAPPAPPDNSLVAQPAPTAPPATMTAPAPGLAPPADATVPLDASDPTSPTSTAAPITMTMPTVNSQPPMTAMGTTVPVAQRAPVAFGDSVMLSAARSLESAGFTVVADEAIQASGTIQMIRDSRAAQQLGRIAIVQVGTNGTITQDDLDQMMVELPPEETPLVIFLTVHADRSWIAPNNALIRALPSRYPNVKVVDWDQIATDNPGALASDGIHVAESDVYADAIAAALGGS